MDLDMKRTKRQTDKQTRNVKMHIENIVVNESVITENRG